MRYILLALLLICSPVHALTFSGVRMGNPDTTTLTGNKAVDMANIGGLTFMKDYTVAGDSTLYATEQNFVQTNGSPVANYSASRSPSIQSTKFTTSGSQTVERVSNVRRQTEGYMNESGFTLARGELIEGSATNLCLYSYQVYTPNWVVGGASALMPASNDYANPFLGGSVGKFTGSLSNVDRMAKTGISFTNGVTYNVSAMVSGSGSIKLRSNVSSVAAESNSNSFTLSNDWSVVSFNLTATESFSSAFIGIKINSENATCYVAWMQVTATAFPSSYIPTTDSTVTRGAETLTYPTAGNINSLENISIVMRYRPVMLGTEQSVSYGGALLIIGNSGVNSINLTYGATTANAFRVTVYSAGGTNTDSSTVTMNRNEEHIVIVTLSTTANEDGKKICIYYDGVLVGSGTAYTPPVYESYRTIRVIPTTSAILEDLAFYQKPLTQAEVTKIQTILTTEQ